MKCELVGRATERVAARRRKPCCGNNNVVVRLGGTVENRFLIEKARSFPALVRMLRVPRARAVVPRWMPRLDGDTADTMGHVPVKIRGGSSKALANGRDPRLSILSTSLLVEGDRVLAGP